MRGHHVLSPCHAVITLAATKEIQEAINSIRFSADSHAVLRSRGESARDSCEDRTETRQRPSGIVVMGPMDKLDAATIVSVYGTAPRAFFQWFEELRSQLRDQQQMLEHCRFEEGWWSFGRW